MIYLEKKDLSTIRPDSCKLVQLVLMYKIQSFKRQAFKYNNHNKVINDRELI